MKIESAKTIARFLNILNRLKILSDEHCDKLIDHLTVRVLKQEHQERINKLSKL